MTKSKKDIAAKIIRVLTIPPIMVALLIGILAGARRELFESTSQFWVPILGLGVFPVLAYPFQKLVKGRAETGREQQRNMAFLFTLIGYTATFMWALISQVGRELMIICSTYFFSVVLLTVCNKLLHIRASGHACSVTAPLIIPIYLVNLRMVVPCLILACLVVWSSLYLKRHTRHDLAMGGFICVLAFAGSVVCTAMAYA